MDICNVSLVLTWYGVDTKNPPPLAVETSKLDFEDGN